jgi:hypothetical protein
MGIKSEAAVERSFFLSLMSTSIIDDLNKNAVRLNKFFQLLDRLHQRA